MKSKNFILSLVCISLLFIGCKNEVKESHTIKESELKFTNDTELVANIIDVIIKPEIAKFTQEVSVLNQNIEDYQKETTESNLEVAKAQWEKVSQQYAAIFAFNIGDVKSKFFRLRLYNWPVANEALEKTIEDQDITEENFKSYGTSVKAIPGIEYLLFEGTSEEVNKKMQANSKRLAYLKYASNALLEVAKLHEETWNVYAEELKTSKATGLDASFSIVFNGLNNVIKFVEETKIGKPSGLVNSKSVNPKILQGYFSSTSLQLIKSNVKSVENVVFNENIISVADKIKSISRNEVLTNKLSQQFQTIYKAIDAFNSPLNTALVKEEEKVKNLYEALTALSVSLSTDVASLFSLIITGTDGDGD